MRWPVASVPRGWLVAGVLGLVTALVAVVALVSVGGGPDGDEGLATSTTSTTATAPSAPSGPGVEPDVVTARTVGRPASGITVTLQRLIPGAAAAVVGSRTELLAHVSGVAAIAGIELWAGDTLVDAVHLDVDEDPGHHVPTWQGKLGWHPTEESAVVLVARAFDADGRSATSNPVRLFSTRAAAPLPVTPYLTEPGDTPASVAAAFGGVVDLSGWFELIDAGGAFPPGTEIGIPQPQALDNAPPPVEPPPPPVPVGDTTLLIAPPAPEPQLDRDGCTAVVPASLPGASALSLVRLLPSGTTFEEVDAIDGPSGELTAPLTAGPHLLAIEAVVDGLATTSPPVRVEGGATCAGEWSGPLRLVNGFLEGVPEDIEAVYLYLSDGGSWRRVPSADQVAVPRLGGAFDLRPDLPGVGVGVGPLEIDVWGWTGGALRSLGRSALAPKNGLHPAEVTGDAIGTSLELLVPDASGTGSVEEWIEEPGTHTFRWRTDVPGATHGVWQVFVNAPLPGVSPLVPGVVAEGSVVGPAGTFEIDLGALIGATPPAHDLVPLVNAYADVSAAAGLQIVETLSAPPPPPGGAMLAGELANVAQLDPASLVPVVISDLYIRVVPMLGDHWPGATSNTVVVHRGSPLDALGPGVFDVLANVQIAPDTVLDPSLVPFGVQASLVPPTPPNPGYVGCWQFSGWDPAHQDPAYAGQYQWWDSFMEDVKATTPLCPGVCYTWYDQDGIAFSQNPSLPTELKGGIAFGAYSGGTVKTIWGGGSCGSSSGLLSAFTVIWKGITYVWDSIVKAFDFVKGVVVDLVAELSGCTTFAKAATSPSKAAAFCKTAATLAVNAVLIAYGIPPNLPNSEQLVALAKGEMAELLVAAAQDLGIPCDELGTTAEVSGQQQLTCEALAKELLAEVEAEMNALFAATAASTGGFVFPPGAIVRPAPAGVTGPPVVTVTVTPSAGAPVGGGLECKALLSTVAFWAPTMSPTSFSDFVDVATATKYTKESYRPARLPGWSGVNDLWGVPDTTYGGLVTQLSVVKLPTEGLAYQVSGGQPSATSVFALSPLPHDGIDAFRFFLSGSSLWSPLPYHSLQLHAGAKVTAEIYSKCTGLLRAEVTLPLFFASSVPFVPVG